MVYVQNHLGQPLMPTQDHRKVRLLLKAAAAVVVRRTPFTIILMIKKQPGEAISGLFVAYQDSLGSLSGGSSPAPAVATE